MEQTFKSGVTLATVIRDEGPYLLEWIAWNRLLGFCNIIIYDNGSVDVGSFLLPRLHQARAIIHRPWPDRPGEDRQMPAFRDAIATCDTEWIGFFDVDEFLVLHAASRVDAFLSAFPAACSAIAFNQRFFGSSGMQIYEDRPVIERFVATAQPDHPLGKWVKSIARVRRIESINNPHAFVLTEGYYADPSGSPCIIEGFSRSQRIAFDVAQYNHYILKSREEYEWKRRKGRVDVAADAADRFEKYSDVFFGIHDVNLQVDDCAARHAASIRMEIQRLQQICASGS